MDRYRRWKEKHDQQWNQPDLDATIAFLYSEMPEPIRALLAERNPDAAQKIEQNFVKEV